MDATPLRRELARHVADGVVPGLVTALARGDEVQVDALGTHDVEGRVPMAGDTLFRIASLTKPIIATAVLLLVQDGALGLDDPVAELLPELATRRVLTAPDAALDDTVPAEREVTVRDLLTLTWGFGDDPTLPRDAPVVRAAAELQLSIGTLLPPVAHDPDEWMRRIGSLPLLYQPGARWVYDVGSDVLGVLLARAHGTDLGTLLHERVFGPLGMTETAFHVPPDALHRLPPLYAHTDGGPVVVDPPDGVWSRPPAFPSGAGGLVSSAADLLAFTRAISSSGGLLDPALAAAMTTDQLTPGQRGSMYLGERGWGFGISVYGTAGELAGWAGGSGTYWRSDLRRDTTAVLLTQCLFSARSGPLVDGFEQVAPDVLGATRSGSCPPRRRG